jgi:hypothetical protein
MKEGRSMGTSSHLDQFQWKGALARRSEGHSTREISRVVYEGSRSRHFCLGNVRLECSVLLTYGLLVVDKVVLCVDKDHLTVEMVWANHLVLVFRMRVGVQE